MSRKGKALQRKLKALAKLAKEKAKMENTTNATTTTTIESGKYKGYSVGYSRGREYAESRFKTCTHYPRQVAQIGDLTLFCATKSTIDFDTMRNKDLVLNVSDVPIFNSAQPQQRLIYGPACFDVLAKHIKPIAELHLKWPDGGTFPVGLQFWRDLYDILIRENYKRAVVCCLGGHGRTGTAFLSLILANSCTQYSEALLRLHDIYCEEAVETYAQDEYLETIEREAEQDPRNYQVIWAKSKAELAAEYKAKADDDKPRDNGHSANCVCESCYRADKAELGISTPKQINLELDDMEDDGGQDAVNTSQATKVCRECGTTGKDVFQGLCTKCWIAQVNQRLNRENISV